MQTVRYWFYLQTEKSSLQAIFQAFHSIWDACEVQRCISNANLCKITPCYTFEHRENKTAIDKNMDAICK